MRILSNNTDPSQQVLIGANNAMSRPIRAARLKNKADASIKANTKKITRALFANENDKENLILEEKETGISVSSKKIKKAVPKPAQVPQRKVLTDITNVEEKRGSDQKSGKKPQIQKLFLEEDEPKETTNYVTLNYVNSRSRQHYSFFCFHDDDLDIPSDYAAKTITHSCDNDCTTDEDQIRGAIKNVFRSIENHIKEQKEAEKRA